MRYATFLAGTVAGVLELAGAIMGLGIAGVGFVFGGGGGGSASTGVGMTMVFAVATIFSAVLVMLVRDARPPGLVMAVAAVGAAIAGGPFAGPGAVVGFAAAYVALRLDRTGSLA